MIENESQKNYKFNIHLECNNNCSFCCADKSVAGEPLNKIMKNVSRFASENGKSLIISGGEPLIFKELFEFINFCRKEGIKNFGIQTNGRMLCYESLVQEFANLRSINFLVSFHFPNKPLYNKYCDSDGFNETIEGIKNLVKYGIKFRINTVIMKPNLPYLQDNINILKNLGSDNFEFYFISGKNLVKNYDKFVPRYSECLPIIKKIIKENTDVNVILKGFPLCITKEVGFKKRLTHYITPKRSKIANDQSPVFEYVFPNCEGCIYKSNRAGMSPSDRIDNPGCCPGVKKDYVDFYGKEEFKPIIENTA